MMVTALLECLCNPGAVPAGCSSHGSVFPSPVPGYQLLARDNRQEKFKHWTEGEQQKNYRCEIVAASSITKLS